jgi:hypothetical protein
MTVNRLMRTSGRGEGNEIMGISWSPFPCSVLAPLRHSRREDGLISYVRVTSPFALGRLTGHPEKRVAVTRTGNERRKTGSRLSLALLASGAFLHVLMPSAARRDAILFMLLRRRHRDRGRGPHDNGRLMKRTWWMRRERGELITRSGRAYSFSRNGSCGNW